ncbi:hypothetical protein KEM52_006560 [Ascosphaera acerosa]|nr:hypothetical protein KEM52_006560 [Ascosphaera acerosa]
MDDVKTALLAEHLSYTPLSLIDDIINSINNLIYQAISSLEDGLTAAPPEKLGFAYPPDAIPDTDADGNIVYPHATLEIENGLHQLETLLESAVDKAFDRFEIYVLRNILTVPDDLLGYIRLSHYAGLPLSGGASEGGGKGGEVPTQEEITTLRQRLRETRKLQRALQTEVARNDAVLAQLSSIVMGGGAGGDAASADAAETAAVAATAHAPPDLDLSFLTAHPAAQALMRDGAGSDDGDGTTATTITTTSKPIATNMKFVVSQLPALRGLLLKLRKRMAGLPALAGELTRDVQPDPRQVYIDGRVQLHLQRHGIAAATAAADADGAMTAARLEAGQKELDALDAALELLR